MLLVTAATARELAPLRASATTTPARRHGLDVLDGDLGGVPVRLVVSGIARTNTAFVLSRLLLDRPPAVLQVGVGGTFSPDTVAVGAVALATSDTYADLGAWTDDGWVDVATFGIPVVEREGQVWMDRYPCDPELTRLIATELDLPSAPFATVETVTGTDSTARRIADRTGAVIESMEGAAAAHACLLADVPFVQLRGVSNVVGARDRSAWRLDDAVAAAGAAAARAIELLNRALS